VNQPQGIAIEREPLAPGKRGMQAIGYQFHQSRHGSAVAPALQDAQGNRGQGGPGCAGQRAPSFVEHSHQGWSTAARIGRRPGEDVLSKDPGMPSKNACAAARIHDDGGDGWLAHDWLTH
jgi:hypothetical protein